MEKKVAVVIPYYHSDLSKTEEISLKQCLKILKNYPIIFLVPDDMSKKNYPKFSEGIIKQVKAQKLKSVSTYNNMMMTKDFYEAFIDYEYILVYQLDAFVFSDKLKYFCELNYDYIGAPWLFGARAYKNFNESVVYVGNGGFSLRKVKSFIQLLENTVITEFEGNEDVLFASYKSEKFKIPSVEEALKFAFERDVKISYQKNKNKLPFGCHAWEKYDFDFWKPYIESYGYLLKGIVSKNLDNITPSVDISYLDYDKELLKQFFKETYDMYNQKIYIFGAGIIGKECGWLLKKINIIDFEYFDNNANSLKKIWGKSVFPPKKREFCEGNVLVIVAVRNREQEIINQLEELGFEKNNNIVNYMELVQKLKLFWQENVR